MKRSWKSSLVLALGVALIAGCAKTENQSVAEQPAAPAQPEEAAARSITITGNDQMKYNITEMRARPGEPLSVTLVNVGQMPKAAMGHNWILLRQDADPLAYVNAAVSAVATDYEPPSLADQVIVATRLIGPGERDTVTFNAPTEPGEYTYLCSFPAHFQVGMKGVLIVE